MSKRHFLTRRQNQGFSIDIISVQEISQNWACWGNLEGVFQGSDKLSYQSSSIPVANLAADKGRCIDMIGDLKYQESKSS